MKQPHSFLMILRGIPDFNHTDTLLPPVDLFGNQKPTIMESPKNKEKFFPSGAIVFFIVLILLTLAFFYGMYFLMLERS